MRLMLFLRQQLFQCLTGSELVLASRIDAECAGPDFPHFGEPPDSNSRSSRALELILFLSLQMKSRACATPTRSRRGSGASRTSTRRCATGTCGRRVCCWRGASCLTLRSGRRRGSCWRTSGSGRDSG